MDPNVSGNNPWPDEPGGYWRRRVFALAAGLTVLGLLAWACSGALGGAKPPPQAPVMPTQAAANQPVGQAAAASSQSPAPPTITATSQPAHNARVTAAKASTAARHRRRSGCATGNVVVTLRTSQQVYPRRAKPRFTIDVVNIGRWPCTFDMGTRALRLVITSGRVRVWGSADCAHGKAPVLARLARGVPYVTHVGWNRHGSGEGCRSVRHSASPGTYVANVTNGTRHSPAVTFVLR